MIKKTDYSYLDKGILFLSLVYFIYMVTSKNPIYKEKSRPKEGNI